MADRDEEFLRQFVEGRDVACPGCGYNVRDLKSPVCPECGQGLVVSLRLAEPRQGAMIAGLAGLAAGLGMGGLMLIFFAIIMLMNPGRETWFNRFVGINLAGALVHGAGLAVWVAKWNAIRLAPAGVRRALVILCWTLPLVFVVVFSIYIR